MINTIAWAKSLGMFYVSIFMEKPKSTNETMINTMMYAIHAIQDGFFALRFVSFQATKGKNESRLLIIIYLC